MLKAKLEMLYISILKLVQLLRKLLSSGLLSKLVKRKFITILMELEILLIQIRLLLQPVRMLNHLKIQIIMEVSIILMVGGLLLKVEKGCMTPMMLEMELLFMLIGKRKNKNTFIHMFSSVHQIRHAQKKDMKDMNVPVETVMKMSFRS